MNRIWVIVGDLTLMILTQLCVVSKCVKLKLNVGGY